MEKKLLEEIRDSLLEIKDLLKDDREFRDQALKEARAREKESLETLNKILPTAFPNIGMAISRGGKS